MYNQIKGINLNRINKLFLERSYTKLSIRRVDYNEYSREALEQLKKGAFLTVRDKDNTNTMTIGWGNIGFIWGKPIFIVMVRYSRHTYKLIESSKEFTISIPLKKNLKKELAYCGTYSGRDVDKFKECNLNLVDSQNISTPIIGECELQYECKVVYQQAMEPGTLDEEIKNKNYSNGDYHIMYFGEILDSYILE